MQYWAFQQSEEIAFEDRLRIDSLAACIQCNMQKWLTVTNTLVYKKLFENTEQNYKTTVEMTESIKHTTLQFCAHVNNL